LQVEPLTVHPDGDVPMPGQESSQVRSARARDRTTHRAASEADCCREELAALVEHRLLHPIRQR